MLARSLAFRWLSAIVAGAVCVTVLFGRSANATEGCDMRRMSASYALTQTLGGLAKHAPGAITTVVMENVPKDPEDLEPHETFRLCIVDESSGFEHCGSQHYVEWVQ